MFPKKIMGLLLILSQLLFSCTPTSSGGGSGDPNVITVTGRVFQPNSNTALIWEGSLPSSSLSYAHVNLCTVNTENKLERIAGTSTVIANSNGAFSLSINRLNIPSNKIIIVCVSSPSGAFQAYSVVPFDLLPTESNQVTSVTVNVSSETTILTRVLCSESILFTSPTKACSALEADQEFLLNSLEGQLSIVPSYTFSSSNWNSLFEENGTATGFKSALNTWGAAQGLESAWLNSSITSGQSFQPASNLISKSDPTGIWNGTWNVSSPTECAGMTGSWSATFALSGNSVSGVWSAPGVADGNFSGTSTDGSLNFQVSGGGGSVSFLGSIGTDGISITGSFSGQDCDTFGKTSGSFTGGRN